MTWRQFKSRVDRLIIEGGGDPNTIRLLHIDFDDRDGAAVVDGWLGERNDRLQIWDAPNNRGPVQP